MSQLAENCGTVAELVDLLKSLKLILGDVTFFDHKFNSTVQFLAQSGSVEIRPGAAALSVDQGWCCAAVDKIGGR